MLEWGAGQTILGHILHQISAAGIDTITVVTGHQADQVGAIAAANGAHVVFNAHYAEGDMLSSLQAGIAALDGAVDGVLIALSDQPMMRTDTVRRVVRLYRRRGGIVIPSYQMRRGHPIVMDRRYWADVLSAGKETSLRDVIRAHSDAIRYAVIEDDHILRDVDTSQAYEAEKRRAGL